jgi:hypothetical protein
MALFLALMGVDSGNGITGGISDVGLQIKPNKKDVCRSETSLRLKLMT